ncbi:MAG TPA: hypothetical protein VLQ78_04330, partial [Ornithinibacter sp.]|nr:hypothetical protein [Ornithinibacter sp.]
MITAPVLLVALALMGIAWTASGIALAVVGRRPRPAMSAAALAVAGAATLAATVLDATEHPQATRQLLVLAWALALPLAVTAYPRLLWRHPVDLVALVTVLGAGTLATLQP